MHYYQFNIGDYIKDTTHLEPMEDLAYRRMIDLYYSTEKALPADVDQIARLTRMRSHSDCIAIVLQDFFTLEDDGYHQFRIDVEIAGYQEKSDKARNSAKARWKKAREQAKVEETQSEGNANALNPQCEGNAKHKPLTNNQEPVTINHKPKEETQIDFDLTEKANAVFEFWKTTFNKTGTVKLTAKRKKNIHDRIKEGYTLDDIKAAITGCSMSAHHMGKNDTGAIYDDIELICRSGEKLEKFRDVRPVVQEVVHFSETTQQNIINGQAFLND